MLKKGINIVKNVRKVNLTNILVFIVSKIVIILSLSKEIANLVSEIVKSIKLVHEINKGLLVLKFYDGTILVL